ncbi:helix-turn-helix domain-containing protein [Nocardia sp. NBC_01388]|uniref:helix-turn-helix domain-containing protein n=1 Tax=Nocardia sp. NBC_01388 TaxID=2903596 RepID=UPI003246CB85
MDTAIVDIAAVDISPDSEAEEMAGLAASRIAFGSYIREIRVQGKKTPLAAGLRIETSRQTIMRLENGLPTKVSTVELERLLDFYTATSESREEALRLWREVRSEEKVAQQQGDSRGFWQPYTDQVFSHFPRYLRLESAANQVTTHQLVLVHGLLQTPDYRRAVVRIDGGPGLSAVDVERRVELAVRRQGRLDDPDFRLNFLMSEAVLRHQPGEPEVMAAQMRWLVEMGRKDNVSIRVIPFGSKGHRGLTIQSFTLLQFPRLSTNVTESPVVYIEGAIGGLYHGRADVVQGYREGVTALEAVALDEADTTDVLLKIAKEYAA